MQIRLDRIDIRDFKRIEALSIELKPVTALVGGNTSGKSSALQATQLGVSILQAAFRGRHSNGRSLGFSATVSNDSVLFRPTEHLLDLKRGGEQHRAPVFLLHILEWILWRVRSWRQQSLFAVERMQILL